MPERDDATRPASRAALFFRAAVPDFLLALVASAALVFTVSYAFESAPDLRANMAVCAGIAAPMLAILFAGSWSKRAVVGSAIGAVAYAAVVLVVLGAQLPPGVPLVADGQVNDVAENPVVFGLVALVVPVVVYLLSRRRVGVVVLFVASVVACGLVQFLYRDWASSPYGTAASVVALLAVGAQFVFQGYRSAVYGAKRVGRTSFGGAAAFSVLIAGACVVVACAVFYGIIAPLGLPTPEVKPFQDLYQRPVVEYNSPYTEQEVENPDYTTNQVDDDVRESNQNSDGGAQGQTSEEQQEQEGSPVTSFIENVMSFDSDNWNEMFQAINYQALALGALFVVLAVAVVLALVVVLWRSRRKRRLEKLKGESRAYGVYSLYTFITGRFEKLGFVRPETFTPLEFAMASRGAMAPFTRGTDGVDYLQLTLAYQRACYAPETLTADDEADVVRYYERFFDNARTFVGRRRWLLWFWRI